MFRQNIREYKKKHTPILQQVKLISILDQHELHNQHLKNLQVKNGYN